MNDEPSLRWTPWTELDCDYDLISPERSKAILAEVIAKLPERVRMLQEYVRRSPGFARFVSDCSDSSLVRLGQWVKRTARIERAVPDKVEIRSPALSDVQREELTEFYSRQLAEYLAQPCDDLCRDIGLYLAACVVKRCSSAKWKRCAAPSYVYFNHPILAFRGNTGFAPLKEGKPAVLAITKRLQEEGYLLKIVLGTVKEIGDSRARRER